MSKVITFSRVFPSYHPRKGEETFFVEKITKWRLHNGERPIDINCDFSEEMYYLCEPKYHTIRAGNRWKVGDKFSPRVWGTDINKKSGRSGPYQSKQIIIAPEIEIKKVWKYEVKIPNEGVDQWFLNDTLISESNKYMQQWFNPGLIGEISKNDGLDMVDFLNWFKHPKPFSGQIICWDDKIEY